jgi:hypothetical protein
MRTQKIAIGELKLNIKNKSANQLVNIYENNQSRLKSGSDLEDGLILNDIVIKEMENRLKENNFLVDGLIDNQIYGYFKCKIER